MDWVIVLQMKIKSRIDATHQMYRDCKCIKKNILTQYLIIFFFYKYHISPHKKTPAQRT